MIIKTSYPFMKPPPSARLIRGHRSAQGLAGLWTMAENGGLQIFDLSGNGNVGNFSGDTYWAAGKYGTVLRFDGVDDWVTVPYSFVFSTGDITVDVLVKFDNNDHSGYVISQNDNTFAGNEYAIAHAELGKIGFYVQDTDINTQWEWESKTYDIVPNVWYHLFLVIKGANVYAYVNGVLEDSSVLASGARSISGVRDLVFGSRTGATSWDLDGDISFVRRWNRGLSAGEIAELTYRPFYMLERRARTALMSGYEVVAPPTGHPYYYREIANRRIA